MGRNPKENEQRTSKLSWLSFLDFLYSYTMNNVESYFESYSSITSGDIFGLFSSLNLSFFMQKWE